MPVLNPSFEDAGALPGEAAHWTLAAITSRQRIAGFGPEPYAGWEDFERWSELLASLAEADVVLAFFDVLAEGREDFEEGWDNDLFLVELPPGQTVTATFGAGAVEDLEDGWANDAYAWAWTDVASTPGVFDGEPREDYEDQWQGNESFAWSWAQAVGVSANFDGGTQTRERFEGVWPAATTI